MSTTGYKYKRLLKKISVWAATACVLSACSTSPTGRSQFLLFSEGQLNTMGEQAFAAMKNDLKISNKTVQNSYVVCITDALLPHVPESAFGGEWEVVVFDDDQINAFALPGGKIGVYTGLLKVARNQSQLAAVIGHEIGHVIAQHSNERMSQSQLINVGSQTVNAILQANQVPNNQAIMSAIGLGLQVGVQLPFSRAHESESDLIGLVLMAKAGFDPRESISLWENMAAAASGNKPPELLSTHPSEGTRIDQLRANMPQAMNDYAASANRPDCG